MDEHGSYSMMHGVQGSRMQSIVICQTDRDVLGVLTPRCAHTCMCKIARLWLFVLTVLSCLRRGQPPKSLWRRSALQGRST
eukprot:470768-Pelagomonas_calceolata.AAC.1